MTELEAAWLAGFLDGEGSFMVTRETKARMASPSYAAVVAASNTNRDLIDYCKALAGGHIVTVRLDERSPNWKQAFHWRVKGRAVGPLIETLLPFLVSKRVQAGLCLELWRDTKVGSPKGRFGTRKTPEEVARRTWIREQVCALNHRGRLGGVTAGLPLEVAA